MVTMVRSMISLWRPPPLRSCLSLVRRPSPILASHLKGKVWGESITATVMFLLEDNHRLWPPPLRLASCKPSFFLSPFLSYLSLLPLHFCLFFPPCLHFSSLASYSSPSSLLSLLSLFFCHSLLAWGVWENLKYHITVLDMGFNPSQPNSVTCHLDNYCERGGQQLQEKIHDYLVYLGLQALQQKGEEIEGATETDSCLCLGGLRGESVFESVCICVFVCVCLLLCVHLCASN